MHTHKQLGILVFGFVMVFSVSLVLILFENVKQQEFADERERLGVVPVSERLVAGEQVAPSFGNGGIANYREYVLASVRLLDAVIERRAAGEAVPSWEAENVHGALFAIEVPSMYRSLHLQLVRLADGLRNEAVDIDAALEQRRILSEQYPWLFIPVQ